MKRLFGKKEGHSFQTKFKEGDEVWMLESKKNQPRCRKIEGVKIQSIKGKVKILYSFRTDQSLAHNGYYDYLQIDPIPISEQYFWVYEKFCFGSEGELKLAEKFASISKEFRNE